MQGSAQPEDRFPAGSAEDATEDMTDDTTAATDQSPAVGAVGDKSNGNRALEETELDSALQLLVERAQYITGATGTALALPQGEEMVCRASAGSSAPAVGARLQVRSGLTGESIARRQLLRCDNADTDPRVNLETCRALGIASIVVLPLLRRSGEVRGLFELFSDHPYAFEERDLIALERMAASEAFRGSPQLIAFLRYVVEATLRGQADRIKGYTIATEALGRTVDFDPQADPIVRVEATRLRRALNRYRAGATGVAKIAPFAALQKL